MGLSLLTLIWMAATLTESLPPDLRSPSFDANPLHQLNLISKARALTGRAALYRLFTIQGVFTVAFGGYMTILALWYVDRLGISEANVGLMLLAVGVFLIFNEMVTLPLVEKRLGDVGTLIVGLCILPVGIFLLQLPTSVIVFLPLVFIVNVGMSLVLPTLQSVVTQAADHKEEGQVQGINTSVSAIASTVAPLAAGATYAAFGGGVTFTLASVAAAVAALTGVLSRQILLEATGEEERKFPGVEAHREHWPVGSLAHCVDGGQRSFSLNINGSSCEHHGLKLSDAAADASSS